MLTSSFKGREEGFQSRPSTFAHRHWRQPFSPDTEVRAKANETEGSTALPAVGPCWRNAAAPLARPRWRSFVSARVKARAGNVARRGRLYQIGAPRGARGEPKARRSNQPNKQGRRNERDKRQKKLKTCKTTRTKLQTPFLFFCLLRKKLLANCQRYLFLKKKKKVNVN